MIRSHPRTTAWALFWACLTLAEILKVIM